MDFGDTSLGAVITGLFGLGTGLLFWWLNRRSKREERRKVLNTSIEAALQKAEEINAQERAEDKAEIQSLRQQVRDQQREIVKLSRGRPTA